MKKILAISLIAFTAVSTANAQIASQAYVDTQDNAIKGTIGTMTNLTTTEKNTVVGAINELASSTTTGQSGLNTRLTTLESAVNNESTGLTATYNLADAAQTATEVQTAIDTKVATLSNAPTTGSGTVVKGVTQANGIITANMGTIYNADVASDAAIAKTKLASDVQTSLTAADNALPASTYNTQIGAVSATNMGTTASTVVTAIKELADATSGENGLTSRVEDLEDAVNDETTGLEATYALADAAQTATEVQTAIDTKVATLSNAPTTGSGTVVKGVTQANGIITANMGTISNADVAGNAAIDMSKIALPTTASEDGVYVLTASALNGTVTYSWEQITGRGL